jgi:putative heme iron utilization protein
MPKQDPIRPTDDEARALARSLIDSARFGALGVIEADSKSPMVTRVAVGTDTDGTPVTLVSDLSAHTRALKANPACSVLLGEPEPKGDPLTHPRLTLQCRAAFLRHGEPGHAELRDHYLASHPKAKLYVDFGDFSFVRFTIGAAMLNGGFGQAFRLTASDFATDAIPT